MHTKLLISTWLGLILLSHNFLVAGGIQGRLAIIDDSASMQGERIRIVRDELAEILRLQPPSVEAPLTLIVFGAQTQAPQTFHDLRSALDRIRQLQGGSGGTNIADAVSRAAAFLERSPQDVILLLYTDGEDPNRSAIERARQQLEGVFAHRNRSGLSQTVIFCKRWQRSNEALKAALASSQARVLDAGDAPLRAANLTPEVVIRSVRRIPEHPDRLEIEFLPGCRVAASISLEAMNTHLEFRCLDPRAEGDRTIRLPIRETSRMVCRLQVPATTGSAGSSMELRFAITPPDLEQTAQGLVLPLLARREIMVPVDVPPLPDPVKINVRSVAIDFVDWSDPSEGVVRVVARLELEVNGSFSGPLPLSLSAPANVPEFLIQPPRLIEGTQVLQLELQVRCQPEQAVRLPFSIVPPQLSGGMRCEPGGPVEVSFIAPPRLKLALLQEGLPVVELHQTLPDNVEEALFEIMPALANGGTAWKGLPLVLERVEQESNPLSLFLGSEQEIAFPVRPLVRPFFRDMEWKETILLRPTHPSAAMAPVEVPVRLTLRAPFHRLALVLSAGGCSLLGGVLLCILFWKLRQTS
jgi:hypothetical protein